VSTETLRPINASGAEFKNVPKSISGKIRRIDLRARENACEAVGLTQEYRDRYRLVRIGLSTPQRKKVALALGPALNITVPHDFGWLLAHPFSRCFVQRVFSKSAASRSEERAI
jgi:hypothetical protein